MKFNIVQKYPLKIQFEDIDLGGAVHNPNYLKFFERARNFHFDEVGVGPRQMIASGTAFALAESHIKFLRPINLNQDFTILTKVTGVRATGLRIEQAIVESHSLSSLVEGVDFSKLPGLCCLTKGKFVCVSLKSFKPVQLPESLVSSIKSSLEANSITDGDISIVPDGKS
jgi:YbgC/YbaW family acyl-CoA thioester hydrolase